MENYLEVNSEILVYTAFLSKCYRHNCLDKNLSIHFSISIPLKIVERNSLMLCHHIFCIVAEHRFKCKDELVHLVKNGNVERIKNNSYNDVGYFGGILESDGFFLSWW